LSFPKGIFNTLLQCELLCFPVLWLPKHCRNIRRNGETLSPEQNTESTCYQSRPPRQPSTNKKNGLRITLHPPNYLNGRNGRIGTSIFGGGAGCERGTLSAPAPPRRFGVNVGVKRGCLCG